MTTLLDLQQQLLDTDATLAQLERAVAGDPNSPSLHAMAESLLNRRESLESAFLAEANSLGIDVCSYRLFGERDRPTILGLAKVLGDFQTLVSVVYDAIKTHVPKERARFGLDVAAATSLEFGYSFAGSLGIVLTIPNERLLIGESVLDEAVQTIFGMAKATQPGHILEHARQLGPAPVRALYRWAAGHAQSGLGVDIEWRRERVIRSHLLAQRPELERLYLTIEATSEETVEEQELGCDLVGADVTRRSFHIRLEDGQDIRGSFKEAISASHTVELPKRYRVKLRRTTRVKYSTEEEEVTFELLNLEPVA